MYNTMVIYLLGLAIIVYGWIFLLKNFLVSFRASESGFRNVAVMLLTIVAVIFAFGAAADAWTVEGLVDELRYNSSAHTEYRQLLERRIDDLKSESVNYTIYAFVLFIAAQLMYWRIKQEIHRNLNKPMERWDWSKIRKDS